MPVSGSGNVPSPRATSRAPRHRAAESALSLGANVPVGRILDAFAEAAWSVELWAGDRADWTVSAAVRARDLGVDAIFGAGGDGVLAQILPAILDTDVALGVVPLGTGNVWARELRLPLQPQRAIAAQLAGPTRASTSAWPTAGLPGHRVGRPGRAHRRAGRVRCGRQGARPTRLSAGGPGAGQRAARHANACLAGRRPAHRPESAGRHRHQWPAVRRPRAAGAPGARRRRRARRVALFGGGPFEATAHAARVLAGLHQARHDVVMRRVRRARFESLAGPLPCRPMATCSGRRRSKSSGPARCGCWALPSDRDRSAGHAAAP